MERHQRTQVQKGTPEMKDITNILYTYWFTMRPGQPESHRLYHEAVAFPGEARRFKAETAYRSQTSSDEPRPYQDGNPRGHCKR